MSTTAEVPALSNSGGNVPLIELKDVGKQYGNIIALKGINLRVGAGEVTGVLGDNGAGKSTLIKIIAGLHQQINKVGAGQQTENRYGICAEQLQIMLL